VTLAYVHDNELSFSWHESMEALLLHDLSGPRHLLKGGFIKMRAGTDGLVAARNQVAKQFLETDVPWLFITDTDMGFEPTALDQLLEVADPAERPIIGGLCFAQRERAQDGMGGYRVTAHPTIYDWVKLPDDGPTGFRARTAYPVSSLVRCAGTGSAMILIHRSVFEKIREREGDRWYDRVPNMTDGGKLISEDLSMCLRAGSAGCLVHVHTAVRTTHHKEHWLSEADFWNQSVAPPAAETVAVLVPVLRRPQNAGPLVRSLRASTGLAEPYAICDADDLATAAAWGEAGATVLLRTPGEGAPLVGTFAQKVNLGLGSTVEPWVFICGDDVRFHAGWLDQAQAVAGDRYDVVGTNDLMNPRVVRGDHATHLLIRRRYVEEVGGGWDGPGVLAHEGYRHWFVDDEIVQAAKQRGRWAMALGSKVEHRHPIFGTAPDDATYQLGQERAKQDQARYKERLMVALGRLREARQRPDLKVVNE
jgi:hypothetical protein